MCSHLARATSPRIAHRTCVVQRSTLSVVCPAPYCVSEACAAPLWRGIHSVHLGSAIATSR